MGFIGGRFGLWRGGSCNWDLFINVKIHGAWKA